MTISSTFAIINSAFASTGAQSSAIASNISNVNTTGYVREIANQVTNDYGGSDVVSVTRQANAALLEQFNVSTSESAAQTAISTGLTTLARTVDDSATASSATGALQNGNSPQAMLGNLQSALTTYEADPSNSATASSVVAAAQNVAASLNAGASAVAQVQEQADQGMSGAVSSINTLLTKFQQANNAVVAGLASGANVTQPQDQRDSILTQLSQQLGVSTTTNTNGSMTIYTDSGVTLFQDQPQTVSFAPTAGFVSGTTGNAVMVGGIPITGGSAPMAIHSGALAGYAQLRDQVAPEYGAQLDQIASGLISAFSETDQSNPPTLPSLPGLFTAPGLTSVPAATASAGLAGLIQVSSNVIPSSGGNLNLLRDGGISSPGNSAYTYNATGAAGYTGRIQSLVASLTTPQSFDPTAGLPASTDLATYASNSVGWLQGQASVTSDAVSYQSSLVTQASAALSNATGVNLDTEMTNMLNIENSYTSAAKLLTTVNSMFAALLQAA